MRIHDFLEFHARFRGDTLFAVQGERRVTYAEANAAANRLAHALVERGVCSGERFCWLSRNDVSMAIGLFAAAKAGAVPIPLNWRLAPPELGVIVRDSGARLVVAQPELAAGLRDVDVEVVLDGPALEAWTAAQPDTNPGLSAPGDDAACQMYTSGTTGRPKGAVLTHAGLLNNGMRSAPALGALSRPGDPILMIMPMFHAGGASFLIGGVCGGATLVIHEDFDPVRFVDSLEKDRIVLANVVPAMLQAALAQVPDIAQRDFSPLRTMIYGASPITETMLRDAMAAFRCDFAQGYGQTEASVVLTFLSPEDHRRALAGRPELLLSAGRALVGLELAIRGPDGAFLPTGEVGEIVARGRGMMTGYWNMPEATAETLRDGWLHTGDAGRLDEEGYLFIEDRVKDMIVSGGENIYPREIENVLADHPDIEDAAVIGVPDDRFGEALLAVVVPRTGAAPDPAELERFCRTRLAGFKTPRRFQFEIALPRNGAGKVLKRELREPHWAGVARRVG